MSRFPVRRLPPHSPQRSRRKAFCSTWTGCWSAPPPATNGVGCDGPSATSCNSTSAERTAADTLREHLPGADDGAIEKHLALLDTFAAEEQTGVIAFPGVRELLHTLPPYRWTVVTSASESMMRDRLGAAGIVAPARVVAGDYVAKGKPDPEGYRRGAALLSRSPGDCVVIEDAPAGVRAGKRAGCRVIGVLSSHAPDELQETDWLVQSIDQLSVQIDESATLKLSFPALIRSRWA